jgi:hypothetical protein
MSSNTSNGLKRNTRKRAAATCDDDVEPRPTQRQRNRHGDANSTPNEVPSAKPTPQNVFPKKGRRLNFA